MELATVMGDTDTFNKANASFYLAQQTLNETLWYADGQYYRSYYDQGGEVVNAVFADSLYGQVVAWTLGLGDLLPRSQMTAHLAAEVEYNDSPYGLIVQTGREDPSNSQDNAIWMGGSQDWTTLGIRLGLPLNASFPQAAKGMDNWRLRLNDQWNVWGLAGGMGLGMDGLHWVTSHYGFHMVLWHTPLAVSGQRYFAPNRSLSFDPASSLQIPYALPILIPNALARLEVGVRQQSADRPVVRGGPRTAEQRAVPSSDMSG